MQVVKKDYLETVDELLLDNLEMRLIAKNFREQNDALEARIVRLKRVFEDKCKSHNFFNNFQ